MLMKQKNTESAEEIMKKINFAQQGTIREWDYEIVDYDKIRIRVLDLRGSNRKLSYLVKHLEFVQIIDMKIGDYNSVTYTIQIGDRKMTVAEKTYNIIKNYHGVTVDEEKSTDTRKYLRLNNIPPIESDCWGIHCMKNNIKFEEDVINNRYFVIYL